MTWPNRIGPAGLKFLNFRFQTLVLKKSQKWFWKPYNCRKMSVFLTNSHSFKNSRNFPFKITRKRVKFLKNYQKISKWLSLPYLSLTVKTLTWLSTKPAARLTLCGWKDRHEVWPMRDPMKPSWHWIVLTWAPSRPWIEMYCPALERKKNENLKLVFQVWKKKKNEEMIFYTFYEIAFSVRNQK